VTIDIAALQPWIGRAMEAEDLVTPRLLAEYRATLAPHLAPVADGEAPLAFHWCLAPAIAPMHSLGPDGHPARGEFLPPVPLPRRMWAGGRIETRGPLRVGDRVIRRSVIADIKVKEGRTGTLCFVSVDHDYLTERGSALSERHDIVYRDVGSAAPPSDEIPEPREADLTWEVAATPTLLFRYSAMTFNGHRIHYDLPYVTGTEGYEGLIVHGPMQASLLFNLAATLGGKVPEEFRYRGVSPLFADQVFAVRGIRRPDGGIGCWTENAAGRICMEAESR